MDEDRRVELERVAKRMVEATFLAELEERERHRLPTILKEITECFEAACLRYLPEWFDRTRMRTGMTEDMVRGGFDWKVHIEGWRELVSETPAVEICDQKNPGVSARYRDVPGFVSVFRLAEISLWVDGRVGKDPGPGEVEIRQTCDRIGRSLGEHLKSVGGER